jgi:hypothetical protein
MSRTPSKPFINTTVKNNHKERPGCCHASQDRVRPRGGRIGGEKKKDSGQGELVGDD